MKKLLGALALSLALIIAPMHAATETTTVVKERKTAAAKRKIAEKKAAARKKAQERKKAEEKARAEERAKPRKESKPRTKHVEKESARAQRKPARTPTRTTTVYKNYSSDKVVGHTQAGRDIYEGPRGGHYYLTESGNKEYVTPMYA